jgi:hypothetical protein
MSWNRKNRREREKGIRKKRRYCGKETRKKRMKSK